MIDDFEARHYVVTDAPTKRELCSCGHAGMGMTWHMSPCIVKAALHQLRAVLDKDPRYE